jgi:hypothetical protein
MYRYEIKSVQGHYVLWVDGKFYCSCDNMSEVVEELSQLEEEV